MKDESEQSKCYYACVKKLKEMGLPISGWECVGVEDMRYGKNDGDFAACDLCGTSVRFLHYMEHTDSGETISVGCVCAGILEGDELAAIRREQNEKNRSMRKSRFLKRKWHKFRGNPDIVSSKYHGKFIAIQKIPTPNDRKLPCVESYRYKVYVDGEKVANIKADGEKSLRFDSFSSAVIGAFEKADPPIL